MAMVTFIIAAIPFVRHATRIKDGLTWSVEISDSQNPTLSPWTIRSLSVEPMELMLSYCALLEEGG